MSFSIAPPVPGMPIAPGSAPPWPASTAIVTPESGWLPPETRGAYFA